MFAKYFGLSEEPFRVTPDRRFLYFGDVHGPVISKLRSAVVRPHGLCLLTGAPGVGKTLALRQVVSMLPEETPVSVLFNAHLDFRGFLDAVLSDFEPDRSRESNEDSLLRDLKAFVVSCRAAGTRPVVFVDEAGNLAPDVVTRLGELIRPGSDGQQRLALVLGCDPAHRDALLDLLKPRSEVTEIAVDPLGREEIIKYIEHRMRAAGWRDGALFYEAALERIVEISGGVPRLINSLAGKALLLTQLCGEQLVTRATVEEAARELWSRGKTPPAAPLGSTELASGLHARALRESEPPSPRPVDGPVHNGAGKDRQTHPSETCQAAPASMPAPPAEGQRDRPQAGHPARRRRLALLTAFALSAALFTVKMSTESGQRDVIETAEPVIENVGRVASGLRELVGPAAPEAAKRQAPVDWESPPRPIPVLTRSARYVSLQEATGPVENDSSGPGLTGGRAVAEVWPEAVLATSSATDGAEAKGTQQSGPPPYLDQR